MVQSALAEYPFDGHMSIKGSVAVVAGRRRRTQSRPIADRAELDAGLAAVRERFAEVEDVPRPETWGGFVLRPRTIEFWQGQQARLHDRFLYTREDDSDWGIERLAP